MEKKREMNKVDVFAFRHVLDYWQPRTIYIDISKMDNEVCDHMTKLLEKATNSNIFEQVANIICDKNCAHTDHIGYKNNSTEVIIDDALNSSIDFFNHLASNLHHFQSEMDDKNQDKSEEEKKQIYKSSWIYNSFVDFGGEINMELNKLPKIDLGDFDENYINIFNSYVNIKHAIIVKDANIDMKKLMIDND